MASFPVRVYWNTAPFADFGLGIVGSEGVEAWSGSGSPTDAKPSTGILDYQVVAPGVGANENEITDFYLKAVMLDPRVDRRLFWGDFFAEDKSSGATFGTLQRQLGAMPSNQNYYTVRFQWQNALTADCMYCIGIDNAEIDVYYSSNGSSWTQVTLDSQWDDKLLQERHWTGLLAQKFATFPQQSAQYWRVDFSRITGQPFYGMLSNIYFGRHYTFEANMSDGHRIDFIADGQSQGGNFDLAYRDSPVFRSGSFVWRFATNDDAMQIRRLFWRKAHGDPVVVQYYPENNPDLHTLYGVVGGSASENPFVIDKQVAIEFVVNELTRGREKRQAGEIGTGSDFYIYD